MLYTLSLFFLEPMVGMFLHCSTCLSLSVVQRLVEKYDWRGFSEEEKDVGHMLYLPTNSRRTHV